MRRFLNSPANFSNETMDLVGDSLNTDNNMSSSTGVIATTSDVIEHNTSTQEETRFTDANFVRNDLAVINDSNLSHLDETTTIVKFLQRPTEVWSASIADADMKLMTPFASNTGWAARSTLKTFDLPKDFMKGRKRDKLNNYEWFKADMVVRFMVNVNPFVAGRMWACFVPMENNVHDECKCLFKSRASITSYPGVEIDLQNNNSAELRVPWCSTYDAISLTDPRDPDSATGNSIGKIHLFSITDMLSGDNTTVIPITAYAWFENIELKGPTPHTVSVQFQAKGEAKGPISEVASKISGAGDFLSKVPVIGGIASSVSWVANIVGGVASIFGWSRPIKGSASDAIVNIPGRGFTNFKAEDSAVVLGMAADNAVAEKETNFMESVDEMDIQHIAARPALVSTIRWVKGARVKATLANQPVGPLVDDVRVRNWTIGSSTYQVYDLSLFESLATKFAYWRADVHYKISITRTPFHVGRLEVVFVPRAIVNDIDIPYLDTTNTWRHVLDMTEQNELEFVVPYMQKNVMCRSGRNPSDVSHDDAGPAGIVGSLIVRALTPLSSPDTVSNFVQVNVWKWATNVCFACPLSMDLEVPPKPDSVAVQFQGDGEAEASSGDHRTKSLPAILVEAAKAVSVIFQGNVANMPLEASTVAFGEVNTASNTLDSACLVGGEMVTNLRQATRAHRAYPLQVTDEYLLNTNLVGALGGFVGYCANIFAFYRGGISYKLIPNAQDDGRKKVTTRLCQVYGDGFRQTDGPEHITYTDLTPFHEVQVPFYITSRRGLCNYKPLTVQNATNVRLGVLVRTDHPGGLQAYVGAKDDLTFGFLFGPPIYAENITSRLTSTDVETI